MKTCHGGHNDQLLFIHFVIFHFIYLVFLDLLQMYLMPFEAKSNSFVPYIWSFSPLGNENNSVHVKLEKERDGPLVSHMCH